jgi:selenocysteine-specific elongation factor
VGDGPIDPAQSRLAQRRLAEALRRHLKRSPLRADLRVDALVSEVRAAEPARASGHRGRQALTLDDRELRAVVDEMVASGAVLRVGHRVRLPSGSSRLDPIMRERLDRLVATLAAGGASPPVAERVAARLGIPPALVDELRATGELVAVGPRIDYPRTSWLAIAEVLDRLAAADALSVRRVRDELGSSRRHAEAILRQWNRVRSSG